jgi:uncharacterized protein (DUF362 family)
MKGVVSLVRYEKGKGSVRNAIELCEGFGSLKPSSRVLIKPNLVGWTNREVYPPFGVLTTSRVLEEIIVCLKEQGVREISIGEASIACKHIGSSTEAIFENLGYGVWQEKYGVRLVDFNKEKMKQVSLDGHKIRITARLDECDFLVNVPVLKTHGLTVVSLGMKNLKGLMDRRSKNYFHTKGYILDHLILLLARHVNPDLTIIDGLYALERGPIHTGRAYRKGLVIASRDMFAADAVGAGILGYTIPEVPLLKEMAELEGRALDLSDVRVVGDLEIGDVKQRLLWEEPWDEEKERPMFFAKQGVEGFRFPKVDYSMCTGCAYIFTPAMLFILSAKKEEPFDNFEILTGKIAEPSGKANKTFLFGRCMVKARGKDPRIKEAVPIDGCPPTYETLLKAFTDHGVEAKPEMLFSLRDSIMKRYLSAPGFDLEDYYLRGAPV